MFSLFFTDQNVYDFETASSSDTQLFGKYFRSMLEKGIYMAPSQYEALFISQSITEDIADKIIQANFYALKEIHE